MDASLSSTSAMAASYEANQSSPVPDPMDLTIAETVQKLDTLRKQVAEMSSKVSYLREIRGRAMALLAQADAAEEEANRLSMEQASLSGEVDRLTSVVNRMEDMRYQTKQLTDQMQLDTALQMRHILENGKSIVPRHPSQPRVKRTISDELASESTQPHFKIPRRDTSDATTPTPHGSSRPASASSPANNGVNPAGPGATVVAVAAAAAAAAAVNGPVHANGTVPPNANKFSPNRSLSLTPGSMASFAALAGEVIPVTARNAYGDALSPSLAVPSAIPPTNSSNSPSGPSGSGSSSSSNAGQSSGSGSYTTSAVPSHPPQQSSLYAHHALSPTNMFPPHLSSDMMMMYNTGIGGGPSAGSFTNTLVSQTGESYFSSEEFRDSMGMGEDGGGDEEGNGKELLYR